MCLDLNKVDLEGGKSILIYVITSAEINPPRVQTQKVYQRH